MTIRQATIHRRSRLRITAGRRGLSIIEVLFAIGIAIVGLLGVIVLIPVGTYHANRSLTSDSATRIGLAAQREFVLRGYTSPDMWRGDFIAGNSPTGATNWFPFLAPSASTKVTYKGFPLVYASNDNTWVNANSVGQGYWNVPRATHAFCIDPQLIATHTANHTIAATNRLVRFPYYLENASTTGSGQTYPRMRRISVATAPTPFPNPAIAATAGALTGPITLAHANSIFINNDDLAIQLDDADNSVAPTPQMIEQPTGIIPAVPVKQQYQGEYSWIATLAPKVGASNSASELYILSIVVFKQRSLALPSDTDTTLPTERVVDFLTTTNSSTGSIEVRLAANAASAAGPAFAPEYLAVSQGDWVLLQGATPSIPYFRWYQVIGSGGDAKRDGNGFWEQYVTLQGPEWLPATYPVPGATTHGQMVIVDGVVGVYQKTIRLETTSLWRN
ncbi:MAG TPA: hypothetical protein DCY79_08320 [Planctomycetaceae bacterium]|nr:hypothetical protein [Planctomycetaceae bacterium]